ncbi:hypothetical protein ACFLTB_04835 [Chloroflexota bacterium]
MFRFVAVIKYRKLLKKIIEYGEVNSDNWPEYKVMVIESLRMACKADTNCSDDILYWNMLATFRRYQDDIAVKIPVEFYTDLFVSLRELSRSHHPELWEMLDKMSDM